MVKQFRYILEHELYYFKVFNISSIILLGAVRYNYY